MELEIRSLDATDVDAWRRLRGALWPDCSLEDHAREMDEIRANPERETVFGALDA